MPGYKLLIGVPVYGRGFPGADGVGQCLRRQAEYDYDGGCDDGGCDGGGDGGNVYDYADLPLRGTTEQHDPAVGNAAFCIDDGRAGFVTYDSPLSVRLKARFVDEMRLGGLFYWHVASDAGGARSLVATGYNALHRL